MKSENNFYQLTLKYRATHLSHSVAGGVGNGPGWREVPERRGRCKEPFQMDVPCVVSSGSSGIVDESDRKGMGAAGFMGLCRKIPPFGARCLKVPRPTCSPGPELQPLPRGRLIFSFEGRERPGGGTRVCSERNPLEEEMGGGVGGKGGG